MFKGINAIQFSKRFYDNESCYLYLIEQKWGKGFHCSQCDCEEYYKGKTYYHRKCKQCRYSESVTANTIFHGMKMPMLKAFHMILRLTAKKKGMSTTELGAEVGVQQKSAWLFKRKVQVVMKQDKNDKMKGHVEVDEFLLGGYSPGERGRSLENKNAVLIAAEQLPDGRTGNIRLQQIHNFEADTLKYAIKDCIDENASIVSDSYSSYQSLKKEIPLLKTKASEKG